MQTGIKVHVNEIEPITLRLHIVLLYITRILREGFLSLQHAINLALIKEIEASSESEIDGMRIQMRRFPYPPYVDRQLHSDSSETMPFLIYCHLSSRLQHCQGYNYWKGNRLKVSVFIFA